MPALDVLALDRNEGCCYNHDLHVLFAASGDIRNVLKTVACLPDEYQQSVSLILNDRDFDIVARNLIMLLAALKIDKDSDEDIETIIHVWYSAKLQSSHLNQLQSSIRPLFQEVCAKIQNKPNGTLLGKTWTFGSRSLRVTLSKEKWMLLPSFLKVPDGLSCSKADKIRRAITLAHERKDYQDRNIFLQKPPHRVCKLRFREDGILLLFAQPRQAFDTPNPTFYQNHEDWPMTDSADPFDGWDIRYVLQTSYGSAANDMYGKLFNHLRDLLSSFVKQATSRNLAFELLNEDVNDLARQLGNRQFARIEVSNVSDSGYLGIGRTLCILSPFLQKSTENAHATMITLFMNAVPEMVHIRPANRAEAKSLVLKVAEYLPATRPPRSEYDPAVIQRVAAHNLVRDNDKYFKEYMKDKHFAEIGCHLGLTMKQPHTIVEEWPMRLKLLPKQVGAKEELETLLTSTHIGAERYVEWRWS
ncbi:hypothetical protein DV736_g5572, partial [Chaetothyriales sp. CBS 134916]